MSGSLENEHNNNESGERIPPTNGQGNPPTNDDPNDPVNLRNYVNTLEQRLASQQVNYRRLESRLEEVANTKVEPPAPPRDMEAEDRKYYTSPTKALDEREQRMEDRLMSRIEKSLEPIRKVANRFAANDAYEELKSEVRSDPAFARAMQDRDVMNIVDRMMSTPGTPMEAATLKMAISSVSWSKQNGMIPGVSASNNNPPRDADDRRGDVNPPYIPPSNRRRDPPPAKRELTEDDRLAMKIGNITDEAEYWKLMDEDVMRLPPDKPRERK